MSLSIAGFCAFLSVAVPLAFAGEAGDELARGFVSPPDSVRPHTWWHWMNGNVTKEGITADLEGMARVGVGGAQIFNVLEGIPDGPVPYLSPQSLDMFRHAAAEAERLGIELCLHNCAGWSCSGGPWIKPERAMQTVVSSETQVKGPKHFEAVLPQPKANLNYYRDIAVVAFPTPAKKATIDQLAVKVLQPHEYQYGLQPAGKEAPADAVVAKDKVVELTSYLAADGKLTWDVPEGNWTILRIGHTPTGAQNAPSPVPGRGLECDKLSREGIDAHWAGGIDPLLKHLGPLAGKVLNNCLIDSYEMGTTNWTPKFRDEFSHRRGYDLGPFLPVLAGRYVGSGEMSERFLWDFRRTIGDLFAEYYYNRFAELCKEHGLLFSVEPYDGPFECLQVGAKADVVMGEFWISPGVNTIHSVKLAATVANTHGIPIVGAESFTAIPDNCGKWLAHPGMLKTMGDAMWCLGINRYIFHTTAHQPWLDKWPCMTMGQWGTHFGRTNTWWELSKPWMKYIARSQYLLQKGRTVADVLYFAGEASPNGGVFLPELKAKGYEYDVVGTDLIVKLTVKDGFIQTPVGGKYRILVLPDSEWMTPQLAKTIGELAKAGATILGPKPKKSPSLTDYPQCDAEVAKTADEVWGTIPSGVSYGRLPVLTGRKPEDVLAGMKVAPDFEPQGKNAKLNFIHRVVGDTDVYFVANPKRGPRTVDCAFRVSGREPELWDAQTGTIQSAPTWEVREGRTIVRLSLEQAGSVFVVFRKASDGPAVPMISVGRQADQAQTPARLTIQKAVYGDFSKPDGKKVDVTAKLAELAKDGDLDITADNNLAGDPAVNIVKELRVDYVFEGKAKSIAVPENQSLQIPSEEMLDAVPEPRLSVEDGQLFLTVGRSGPLAVLGSDPKSERLVRVGEILKPAELTGSWDVAFQEGRGAPAKATFEKLISLPEHKDAGIKYFSGTAVYRKTINVPAERFGENRSILLDLGSVKEIAEVRLNGQDLGILWKAPFRVDITKAAKAGDNELDVRVTNLWPNRLIGDEQYPDDCQWDGIHLKQWPDWMLKGQPRPVKERLTFTTWKHWKKDSPLQPSGLLGSVKLLTLQKVPVE